MKSKFIRLPEGGGIMLSEIRAVRVFVDSTNTRGALAIDPRVGIDYSMPGENGQSHAVSHFGTEEDARVFADSVISAIDEQHNAGQSGVRSAAIEECAQNLEEFASQFHMDTPTGNRIQDILRGVVAAMRAMK